MTDTATVEPEPVNSGRTSGSIFLVYLLAVGVSLVPVWAFAGYEFALSCVDSDVIAECEAVAGKAWLVGNLVMLAGFAGSGYLAIRKNSAWVLLPWPLAVIVTVLMIWLWELAQ